VEGHSNDALLNSVADAKQRFLEIENKKLEVILSIASMEAIAQSIDTLKDHWSNDVNKNRSDVDIIEAENNELSLRYEALVKEAEDISRKTQNHKIEALIHEHFKGKNKRAL